MTTTSCSRLAALMLLTLLPALTVTAQVTTISWLYDPLDTFGYIDDLGSSLAMLGDLDGDGLNDLAFSATTISRLDPYFHYESLVIAFMDSVHYAPCLGCPADEPEWFVRHRRSIERHEIDPTTSGFGRLFTALDDLDGDGINELAVASDDAIFVLFLNSDGSVRTHTVIKEFTAGFSDRMAYMGDLDPSDGTVELLYAHSMVSGSGVPPSVLLISIDASGGGLVGETSLTAAIEEFNDYEVSFTAVANVGDIDGNGVNDFVSGDTKDEDLLAGKGSYYVVFLDADGEVINVHKQRNFEDDSAGGGGDAFGKGLAGTGDVDDNPETTGCLAVTTFTNEVWTACLKPDGSVDEDNKRKIVMPPTDGGYTPTAIKMTADHRYVALYASWGVGSDGGSFRLAPLREERLPTTNVGPNLFDVDNDYKNLRHDYDFGAGLGTAGRLTHDGMTYTTVVVGDPQDSERTAQPLDTTQAGAAYLLFLKPDGEQVHAQKILPESPEWGNTGGHFGSSFAQLDDPDGDGIPDLAIGAPGGDAVWVFDVNSDGTTSPSYLLGEDTPGLVGFLPAGERFGASLAYLGDLDDDGAFELAVGVPGDDEVWLLSVRGTDVERYTVFGDGQGGIPLGTIPSGTNFGKALTTATVDGDGMLDLVVGSEDGFYTLFINPASGFDVTATPRFVATAWHGLRALTTIGDLDGDERSEIATLEYAEDTVIGRVFDFITLYYLDASGLPTDIEPITSEDGAGFEDDSGPFWEWTSWGLGTSLLAVDLDGTAQIELLAGEDGYKLFGYDPWLDVGLEGLYTYPETNGTVWVLFTEYTDTAYEFQGLRDDLKEPWHAQSLHADAAHDVPDTFALRAAYPNPFNPQTTIQYDLPEAAHVRLTVYDLLGRQVALLTNAPMQAGTHTVTFEAGDLASGTYLYRLDAGTFSQTKRMVLIK